MTDLRPPTSTSGSPPLLPSPPRAQGLRDVVEPVPPELGALLRRAVLEHRRTERRRVFAPVLHVGVPGLVTRRLELADDLATEALDHALRVDVLSAMLRRVRRPGPLPLVWLTRRGPLDLQDRDLAWRSSARAAAGEMQLPLHLVVVDKHGWCDPGTAVGRTWVRVR